MKRDNATALNKRNQIGKMKSKEEQELVKGATDEI